MNLHPNALSAIDLAFCGAASLFSHIYIQDLGFYSRVVIIIKNFKVFLENQMIHSLIVILDSDGQDKTRLVWVLVIAAIAAREKPECRWFVEKLR